MSAPPASNRLSWHPALAAARGRGVPIVALESSVFAQGLPTPENRDAHTRMCAAVRSRGAEPAVTATVAGSAVLGLDGEALERFLTEGARKVSARDLGWALSTSADGATTVAATLAIATAAGVDVFATGGIGGVHRGAHPGAPTFDESADLIELSRSSVITVCAGAKAILDVPATVERLESYGVAVVGYRTNEFPGFFTSTTGITLSHVADSPAEVARAFLAARAIGGRGALLVVQAPPAADALDATVVESAVGAALRDLEANGIRGAAVTPFLLGAVERATGGRSLRTNLALLEANASLAGEIAVALATERGAA